MKARETHANGAIIELTGRAATVNRLLAEWRAVQSPKEPEPETEPDKHGSEAHTERVGYRGYESSAVWAEVPVVNARVGNQRQPIGFSPDPVIV